MDGRRKRRGGVGWSCVWERIGGTEEWDALYDGKGRKDGKGREGVEWSPCLGRGGRKGKNGMHFMTEEMMEGSEGMG